MQHIRKSQSAGQEEHELLHRMASLRTPPRVDFNAYLNEQQDRHGLMGKVTSKLGGMFRGVKDVFGSIGAAFKSKEEPDTFRCSVSPSRVLVSSKDANFSSFRNNPINNVDFRELSNILKPNLPNDSFGPLNNSRNEINGNNISFGRANISNSHQEPLNQSSVSQSNSASINDSNVTHKSSGKGSKKIEVKRKKRIHYNTASVINYWTAIFEENCKKYSMENSQKRFSRNVKTILVEGIKKPIPQKKKFNSVDFKKNPATGAMEIVRHNKKRKNMEVEPLEDDSLANMVLNKSVIQVEKDKPIQPQLKKNKLNVAGSVRSSLGSANNGNLITYKVQKRRTGAIFVDSCQEEEMKQVVKAKSPIRNLIFEEDKQCNRSTDTDSGFGEVRNHTPIMNLTQEKGCQTSAAKIKMDTQIQTSPLRSRSLLLSASRKSYEELKEETLFKKNSRVQSKVASPINVKTDSTSQQTYEMKPQEEVIPVAEIQIPVPVQENKMIPRTLNFDTSEENSRKDPISLSIANVLKQQQQQENSVVIEETKPEEKPIENKSFLPEAQPIPQQQALPKNLFANTVPTPTPVQSQPQSQSLNLISPSTNVLNSAPVEGKKSLTIRKLEVNPTKVETNNKPVFEFLKQYEAAGGANKIKENNPFLNTSHQQLSSPNDALNTSAGNNNAGGNPFLAGGAGGQSVQSGILGLIERQSSEKKSNQSFELKPVTNNDLFGPKTENNTNMRNGLFNNIASNNNQGGSINPNLPNNTNSLFGHIAPKQNNNNNLFNGPLIGKKDEMDIMDNRMGGGSVTNNLFSANPVQTQNTPNFLQQQPAAQNNLFNFQNQQQQNNRSGMSGMEVVNGGGSSAQNNLFGPSNNLFGGNSNNTSNNNTNNLFANTNNNNNNNRPAIQLFANSNNNNGMNNNNLFSNTSNNNGGFMESQMGFGNPQGQNQLNLFNNPMQQNSNNAAPNKLVFTSTSPFDNKPVGSNNGMNNNNLFGNNNNNNFSNQNQGGFLPQPPPLQHNMSFGQQNNPFGNTNSAANFLNLGADNNAGNGGGQGGDNGMGNNGGNDANNANNQNRVFRRIIQPQQKNRTRAF